jgi:hypothetical protein
MIRMALKPSHNPSVGGAQKSHGHPGAQLQVLRYCPFICQLAAIKDSFSLEESPLSHTAERIFPHYFHAPGKVKQKNANTLRALDEMKMKKVALKRQPIQQSVRRRAISYPIV